MKYDIDYSGIPEHMRESVRLYLEHGLKPGSFLTAILEDKLVESVAQVDNINIAQIVSWAKFLWNEMPMGSWGSKEKVEAWIKKKKEELHEKD